jgi:hypothetical protein
VKTLLDETKIFLTPKYIKTVFFDDKNKNITERELLDRLPLVLERSELDLLFR